VELAKVVEVYYGNTHHMIANCCSLLVCIIYSFLF